MHDEYQQPGLDPAVGGGTSRYGGLLPALFSAALLAAVIAALAVGIALGQPGVRQLAAQMLCAQGDRVEAALPWSGGGQSPGAWCVGEDGQRSASILPWLYLGAFVLIFDVCVLAVILLRRGRRAAGGAPMPGVAATFGSPSSGAAHTFQSIVINGRAYSSPDEMPPDIRQMYTQMQDILGDANRDGIPDLFEGMGKLVQHTAEWGTATVGDPAQRLQKLKEMRDAGLISEEEYQAKRADILASM